MGRNKKPGKAPASGQDTPRSISFELEEDAEQLMLEHLAAFKPIDKDTDEKAQVPKARPRPAKARLVRRIDLHGLHLEQAIACVQEKIDAWLLEAQPLRVQIITGKGRHSEGGKSVLAREIHRFVEQRYQRDITEIEESPDQVRLSGLPLRGHFHVTFKARTNPKKARKS